ncbi:helix-turn-helix domain-containing protein [Streptomyces sp. NRRL F-5126]|uniref:helix-turn-helix domain-containing protein n=1 Tax=Streptomyces sp. NRRL F-5126 TaxID=1463857 RepID=UPI0004C6CABC|nr:helix-turn-helix transcriptional regulator [Streptomyces sp. NRRL F-5126]
MPDDDGTSQGVLLSGEENAATRVKLEREKRGWSTTVVSDRLNDAGFDMNPSAVWRIENRKRRINLDEAIGFAEIFGVALSNFVGPPGLATMGRAMELIDNVVATYRASHRANHEARRARDQLDAYLAEHPDIREEADVMVSNAIAGEVMKVNDEYGPGSDAEA